MNPAQEAALRRLTEERYDGKFRPEDFAPAFDLPDGWVAGWINSSTATRALYVGCDPDGVISS